jgi:uncharacterized protein (UPF0276 family)
MPAIPPRPREAPDLGFGVGLRPKHYPEVLARARRGELEVDWLEAISENYMLAGGRPLRVLAEVRAACPLVLHGVSLNLASTDPLDTSYLDALAALASRFEPAWLSDHLCWTGVAGENLHDLLPVPMSEESVRWVAARIARVQDRLGRRIAVENVSSYAAFREDAMPEAEFLAAVCESADCGILLDVNNVFVSAHNHGWDAQAYIDAVPAERVFQLHLAGHSESGSLKIDSHDHAVCDGVWALYAHAIRRLGPVSTLIEWDDRIPELERLVQEVERARAVAAAALAGEGEGEGDGSTPRGAAARGAAADAGADHRG